MKQRIYIIGGGTVVHIRNKLALSAPDYGEIARHLNTLFTTHPNNPFETYLHLTKMAGGVRALETDEDVRSLVECLVIQESTKAIIFCPTLVGYQPTSLHMKENGFGYTLREFGLRGKVLQTSDTPQVFLKAQKTPQIVNTIRNCRKDIFLAVLKTTSGLAVNEQRVVGTNLLNNSNANIVLITDNTASHNTTITLTETHYTLELNDALHQLVDKTLSGAVLI